LGVNKGESLICVSLVGIFLPQGVLFPFLCLDYRCEDGRFPVPASCVTISNPDSLSSSETGVNPGIRSWKNTYLNELDVRKPLVQSISQKSEELRLYNLVWNLKNFKPLLKSGIFKCISWLNGSFFLGWWSGVFWKGESRPF
jgi:hypothetical protein